MNLSGLLPLVREVAAYRQLVDAIEQGSTDVDFDILTGRGLGIISAARPYLVAALYRQLGRPIVLLTTRAERVSQWVDQLCVWTGSESVLPFPEPDALPYERVPWSRETVSDRLSALTALLRWERAEEAGEPPLVVASARAFMHKTLPVREFRMGLREYRVGQEIRMQRTLETWVSNGYRPDTVVQDPGTFSRRGGLIDVFPPNLLQPVRIELFGDEIDSLRVFDPTTQRSDYRIERFALAPATEALPRLAPAAAAHIGDLDLGLCHPPARMEYKEDRENLEQGAYFRGIEFYLSLFYSRPAVLLDYLPDGGLCIVDDWDALMANVMDVDQQAEALQADLVRAGELPTNLPQDRVPYFAWEPLRQAVLARAPVVLGGGLPTTAPSPPQVEATGGRPVGGSRSLGQAFAHGERYGGQLRRVLDGCQELRRAEERVLLVTRQARRISNLLDEQEITAAPVADVIEVPPQRSLILVQGTLAEGWVLRGVSDGGSILHLLTDAEIFGWAQPASRRARRPRPMSPETFFADVEPGSYVVHVEHGVGLFQGLTKMVFAGGEREYLLVEYAAEDKLYVPVYQADRLSRYVGVGEESPSVNRLGTARWSRVKARAKKAVEEIADDLLALYAVREVVEGHAFSPDTFWQAELEGSFPYIETEAQLYALDEVKDDMEKARPMDRLVCGDVGYGKTEVALRAAFKAVMDGKQVAVLVPTTVLAQQHHQTFTERLKPFPVQVEMLSRFLTRKQQEDVVDRLAQGGVDIVIGTHRLLSDDVAFKDLGLLIIDEEQRFGVAHKEQLKQMRHEIDVLTL
ncbi:MAG: CarD family transcriptional regulator, partial [Anaerolineae bacterium]